MITRKSVKVKSFYHHSEPIITLSIHAASVTPQVKISKFFQSCIFLHEMYMMLLSIKHDG